MYQLRSFRLWTDSITSGLAIFGFISAIATIAGLSISNITDKIFVKIIWIIIAVLCSYLVAVIWKWVNTKDCIKLKIRGISVIIRQGNIFDEEGWKVINVDDTFSTSEDDAVISHSSIHGKFLKQLRDCGETESFKDKISCDKRTVSLGCVKTYGDYILLAFSHLNNDNEAHIENSNYENILRKMWSEIGRVYSGKPIVLPIVGDGVTRFDGVSEKPSPFELLKCMLCTLRTSNVQIKASITILVYDRINEINLYNLKKVSLL